jgi:hypothetical protein
VEKKKATAATTIESVSFEPRDQEGLIPCQPPVSGFDPQEFGKPKSYPTNQEH